MAYKTIFKFYEQCFDKHGDNHLGVDWTKGDDVNKRYKVMLEVIRDADKYVSVLDFGCGLSHMYQYILDNSMNIEYEGLDISEKFVGKSKEKYPLITYYQMDLLDDDSLLPNFDYIIMNGVFTEKLGLCDVQMFDFLCSLIKIVFKHVQVGMAFNVMSPVVDWTCDNLFYLSVDKILRFVCLNLSRNVVIRHDYGLYEYTVYVYK
jgi:SAM-dependent methyltransferase